MSLFYKYAIHSKISFQSKLYVNVKISYTNRFVVFVELEALQQEKFMHYVMIMTEPLSAACREWGVC